MKAHGPERRRLRGRNTALLAITVALSLVAARGEVAADGADAAEQYRRAGEAYEQSRHEEAVRLYEGILAGGYDDARVHYNLGNALFKAGRLGPAILAYERALARDPADADARENLAYAELQTVDKVGELEPDFLAQVADSLRSRVGADRATAGFAILLLVSSILAVPLWFLRRGALAVGLRIAAASALTAAFLCAALAAIEVAGSGSGSGAIVLAPTVDGRSAPSTDGTTLFTVHEGLKVQIRGERSGWVQVVLPNGLVGWIESSRVERI